MVNESSVFVFQNIIRKDGGLCKIGKSNYICLVQKAMGQQEGKSPKQASWASLRRECGERRMRGKEVEACEK